MPLIAEQLYRLRSQLEDACGLEFLDAMREDTIEDLALNPDSILWAKRRAQEWQPIGSIEENAAYAIVHAVAAIKGRDLHDARPVLETIFPLDDSRFEAVIPPITRRPVFSLRIKRKSQFKYADWEAQGVLTHRHDPLNIAVEGKGFVDEVSGLGHSHILTIAAQQRKTILVVGPTGSGKTTLADTHLLCLGGETQDRVVYIEDTPELVCDIPNSVDLLANEDIGIDMLRCVRIAMRLRPKRIVVGEVRGAEAHALLKAWNTGHPGGVATVHADNAYAGLLRLESLVAESPSANQQSTRELIAQAIHLVVFIEEDARLAAGRKVREILAVTGFEGGRYITKPL